MRGNKTNLADRLEMGRLRFIEGRSYQAIAEQYKIDFSTVFYHVRRVADQFPADKVHVVRVRVKRQPIVKKQGKSYADYLEEYLKKQKRTITVSQFLKYYP